MSEKQVEARLRNGVKRLNGKAYKWVSPGNPGVFDRLVVMPSEPGGLPRIYIVELKRDRKQKLSPHQLLFQKEMLSMGIRTYVLYCNEDVDNFIMGL